VAHPLVSVVVPAFEPGDYLREAIESLLGQTYPSLEIIVVDDGSTPPCRATCEAYRGVRYFAQQHRGPAGARNAGVERSSGAFIAFQDADDLSTPERIEVQMSALQGDPSLGLVLSRLENFHAPGFALPAWFREEAKLRSRMGFVNTALVRRDTLAKVGPFDTAYQIGEDVDWLVRARDAGVRRAVCPEVLVRRRIHGRNLSANVRLGHQNLVRILRASVQRRVAS
jgi:glycosyltransferase involved in cell wall biosynthesis